VAVGSAAQVDSVVVLEDLGVVALAAKVKEVSSAS